MTKRAFGKTSPLLFSLLCTLPMLQACGGGEGAPGGSVDSPTPPAKQDSPGNPSSPGQPSAPGPVANCDHIVFDRDEMAAHGVKLPQVVDGDLIVAPTGWEMVCDITNNRNGAVQHLRRRGYAQLSVTTASAQFIDAKVVPGRGEAKMLAVTLRPTVVDDARLQRVLQILGVTGVAKPAERLSVHNLINGGRASPSALVKGQDPFPTDLSREGDAQSGLIRMNIYADAAAEDVRSAIYSGRRDEVKIAWLDGFSAFSDGDLLSARLSAREGMALTNLSSAAVVGEIWNDHARSEEARIRALELASRGLSAKKLAPNDFITGDLRALGDFCVDAWRVDPKVPTHLHSLSLELLVKIGRADARLAFYSDWKDKISSVSPTNMSDDEALKAAMDFYRDGASLTDVQRGFVLSLAQRLKAMNAARPWTSVLQIAQRIQFDDAQLDLIGTTATWIKGYPGPSFDSDRAVSTAIDLVTQPGFDAARLEVLKKTFAWIQGYPGPSISDREEAFEQAKALALQPGFNAASLDLIRATFAWLQGYPGPSISDRAEAFKEAKLLSSQAGFNQNSLTFMQEAFAWLQGYPGPSVSDRAEAYKETKALSALMKDSRPALNTLKANFAWIQGYPGPSISDRAEAYKKAKNFFARTNGSPESFEVIKEAYAWLQGYPGPSLSDRSAAYAKAEGYVLVNKMDPAKLQALKASFAKFAKSTSSREEALQKAEKEVLGSPN